MGGSRIRVVFDVVRSLAVPDAVGISFIDRFLKSIFPTERKLVTFNSELVPVLVINDLPDQYKGEDDRVKDVTMKKEKHPPRLVYVVRKTNIPP